MKHEIKALVKLDGFTVSAESWEADELSRFGVV